MALRATYIVDPNNVVQLRHGEQPVRRPQSGGILRVLDALQTDELCPCNWTQGEAGLDPEAADPDQAAPP